MCCMDRIGIGGMEWIEWMRGMGVEREKEVRRGELDRGWLGLGVYVCCMDSVVFGGMGYGSTRDRRDKCRSRTKIREVREGEWG